MKRYCAHVTLRALALSVLCVAPNGTSAADWPNWRGPNHDGTIDAPGQFFDRPFGLEIVWKRRIGSGYSGMTVAQGRLLTMFADGESDLLAAFNAQTGSELWRFRMGDMYPGHDGGHDGPLSTPVADHDTVYALGAHGRLVAVALDDGSLRWSVNLVEKLRASVPFWGFTTTPLIVDNVIVVQAGGRNGRALTAFDRRNGTIRWTLGNGRIDYRSPALATLNGIRQLIVSTSSETMGVNPADGEKLWSRRFGSGNGSTPVPIEPDRVLLLGNGAQLLRIPKGGGKPARIWRSSEFRGNYATPVFFQEHLYGFSRDVLTCVDARTGKRRWRSRQPGGKGVILVDGHLVILGAKGDVVVAEASPSGYREKARVAVSDADGYAAPCYSDGIIYARTLRGDVAAVRAIDTPSVARRMASSTNRFERFITKLTAAEDKRKLLDEFMDSQTSFPIVEDGRLVHFVYRGPAEDVSILGTMIAQGEHDQLSRVDGADLFYRSYPIEPGARFEYRFTVDFDHTGPDPLNSRRAPGNRGVSEVVTPAWTQPHFVSVYDGPAAGRTESFSFKSDEAGGSCGVRVYLPHGYDRGTDRYPTIVVAGGQDWLERG
ncbi:MAG: PQQ-binding-like beta-propeller repeat protein, partial [Planctomycetes bacterium]|nr:PQQ-binding-like beta-propeller repeat protein [Planctomycetota bacterium]